MAQEGFLTESGLTMEQRGSEAGTQRGGSARMKVGVLGRRVCRDLAVKQVGAGCVVGGPSTSSSAPEGCGR